MKRIKEFTDWQWVMFVTAACALSLASRIDSTPAYQFLESSKSATKIILDCLLIERLLFGLDCLAVTLFKWADSFLAGKDSGLPLFSISDTSFLLKNWPFQDFGRWKEPFKAVCNSFGEMISTLNKPKIDLD